MLIAAKRGGRSLHKASKLFNQEVAERWISGFLAGPSKPHAQLAGVLGKQAGTFGVLKGSARRLSSGLLPTGVPELLLRSVPEWRYLNAVRFICTRGQVFHFAYSWSSLYIVV